MMKRIDEATSNDFFFCYTKSLSLYLKEQGIPYIIKAKSVRDGDSIFTLYAKGEKLQAALDEFKTLER